MGKSSKKPAVAGSDATAMNSDEEQAKKRPKLAVDIRHLRQDLHTPVKKRGETCHILPTWAGVKIARHMNNPSRMMDTLSFPSTKNMENITQSLYELPNRPFTTMPLPSQLLIISQLNWGFASQFRKHRAEPFIN